MTDAGRIAELERTLAATRRELEAAQRREGEVREALRDICDVARPPIAGLIETNARLSRIYRRAWDAFNRALASPPPRGARVEPKPYENAFCPSCKRHGVSGTNYHAADCKTAPPAGTGDREVRERILEAVRVGLAECDPRSPSPSLVTDHVERAVLSLIRATPAPEGGAAAPDTPRKHPDCEAAMCGRVPCRGGAYPCYSRPRGRLTQPDSTPGAVA